MHVAQAKAGEERSDVCTFQDGAPSRTFASPDVASSLFSPSSVALYPLPLRCIVACHCHSIHSFTVQSHSGPRRSISLSLLPSDQHALPSRSVAGLPVLLCIGCDAQLACASRLSHFTLLGNDPTLRGLHPLYLTPLPNGPFPWCPPDCYRCQRTPTGHATLGGEIAPALTPAGLPEGLTTNSPHALPPLRPAHAQVHTGRVRAAPIEGRPARRRSWIRSVVAGGDHDRLRIPAAHRGS